MRFVEQPPGRFVAPVVARLSLQLGEHLKAAAHHVGREQSRLPRRRERVAAEKRHVDRNARRHRPCVRAAVEIGEPQVGKIRLGPMQDLRDDRGSIVITRELEAPLVPRRLPGRFEGQRRPVGDERGDPHACGPLAAGLERDREGQTVGQCLGRTVGVDVDDDGPRVGGHSPFRAVVERGARPPLEREPAAGRVPVTIDVAEMVGVAAELGQAEEVAVDSQHEIKPGRPIRIVRQADGFMQTVDFDRSTRVVDRDSSGLTWGLNSPADNQLERLLRVFDQESAPAIGRSGPPAWRHGDVVAEALEGGDR